MAVALPGLPPTPRPPAWGADDLAATPAPPPARLLTKEAEKFEAAIAALARKPFACADDASAAAAKLTGKLAYHVTDVTIEAREVTVPRARRGRPAKGEVAPTTTEHRVVFGGLARQEAAVAEPRFHARHFVLVTDHLDQAAWPDERVLAEYRHQHIIEGHTGFRWLKNVAHVAPMFLHTPERMAALGLVLVLGLMVRNYAQFELRAQLAREDERVPDRLKKPTQKPTLETAMTPFVRASVIHVLVGEQRVQRRPTTLPSEAKLVLRLLRVDEAVFAVPRERKFTPAASENPEM